LAGPLGQCPLSPPPLCLSSAIFTPTLLFWPSATTKLKRKRKRCRQTKSGGVALATAAATVVVELVLVVGAVSAAALKTAVTLAVPQLL
jgi:hypothetical protein